DAGDADEEVHVAQDLREDDRWYLLQRDRRIVVWPLSGVIVMPAPVATASRVGRVFLRVQAIEAHLISGQIQIGAGLVGVSSVVVTCALDPVFRAQFPVR